MAEAAHSVRFVTVDSHNEGQRVDNFLITFLKGVPKTLVYRIIRKGEVRVNKKRVKAVYRLQVGDVL
ncbi:S4 domain-containing protein, partial [Oceanospirillum sp. HFRX-1_2]